MKCFNHPESDAVATCPDCGKTLCKPCSIQFDFPICSECNKQRNLREIKQIKKEMIIPLILGFIIAVIMLIFYVKTTARLNSPPSLSFFLFSLPLTALTYLYLSIATVIGYLKIKPRAHSYFLILPWFVWLFLIYIYIILGFFISLAIGIFITPSWYLRRLRRLKQLRFLHNNGLLNRLRPETAWSASL